MSSEKNKSNIQKEKEKKENTHHIHSHTHTHTHTHTECKKCILKKKKQQQQCDWNGEVVSHQGFVSTAVQPYLFVSVLQCHSHGARGISMRCVCLYMACVFF